MYSALRDAYLAHVFNCSGCRPNHVGLSNNGQRVRLPHWTIYSLCPISIDLLSKIGQLF